MFVQKLLLLESAGTMDNFINITLSTCEHMFCECVCVVWFG